MSLNVFDAYLLLLLLNANNTKRFWIKLNVVNLIQNRYYMQDILLHGFFLFVTIKMRMFDTKALILIIIIL